MQKAIFLDRDGTLIKLVFNKETDSIDTVSNKNEVEFTYDFPEVLKKIKDLGYLLIVISNQPRIALGKDTKENFEDIHVKMNELLKAEGVKLDKEYYCFHHPFAEVEEYRQKCECRKPGIKFFQDAQKEFDLDLSASYMIGDGVNDILAGYKAGVKTILFGNLLEGGYLTVLQENLGAVKPDFLIKKPKEILEIVENGRN